MPCTDPTHERYSDGRCGTCKRAYERQNGRKGMSFSADELEALDQVLRALQRGTIADGAVRTEAFRRVAAKLRRAQLKAVK